MNSKYVRCIPLIFFTAFSFAQQGYHADYSKLINSAEAVGPVGDSSFGENVNLYSGKTTFQHTDFSISGNSQIPVSIGRTYNVENRNVTKGKLGAFGDWDLDVPRLEGIFPASLAWNRDDRCTKFDVLDPTALQQSWSDAGLITTGWNSVEGIVGYRYEVNSQQVIVDANAIVSGAAGTVNVIANQNNPVTLTTGGVAEFDGISDRTVALKGSSQVRAAFLIISLDTRGRSNIPVAFNIRDLDTSMNDAKQQIATQYRIGNTGDFTNIPGGYFPDVTNTGTTTLVTPVALTLPVAADNKPLIQIRILTAEAARGTGIGTSNEWVGIDDIAIGAIPPDRSATAEESRVANSDFRFAPSEYGYGIRIHVPGKTSSILLKKDSLATMFPTDVGIVTNDYWAIKCIPNGATGPSTGDAFLALSPDGMKYTFARIAVRPYSSLKRPTGIIAFRDAVEGAQLEDTKPTAAEPIELARVEVWMMVTQIEDRFGNTVTYNYASGTQPAIDSPIRANVLGISSSDGRSLAITYLPNNSRAISSISSSQGNWVYGYDTTGSLNSVAAPTIGSWLINLSTLSNAEYTYATSASCSSFPIAMGPASILATIKSPFGAEATYTFKPIRHSLSGTPNTCITTSGGAQIAQVHPSSYDTITLTEKSVLGAGISRKWVFAWEAGTTIKSTTVTGPASSAAGDSIKYTFGNSFGINEGLLVRQDVTESPFLLENTILTYESDTAGLYPARFGFSYQDRGDIERSQTLRPLKKREITRHGREFEIAMSAFSKFGQPLTVTRGVNPQYTSTFVYQNSDTSFKWILGALTSVISAGVQEASYTLNDDLQPATVTRFGKLDETLTYNQFGLVETSKDGRNLTTTLSSYTRGIPRLITYHDGKSVAATVNGLGLLSSVRNEILDTTTYGYDGIGRLTSIDPPEGSSTSIAYSINSSNAWRTVKTRGADVTTTNFNGYLQPISINRNGRSVSMRYDDYSRLSFRSYPNLTSGIEYYYNALGEPTVTRQDSELGDLDTRYTYGANFNLTVTDPRGNSTDFSYRTYDTPSRAWPISINEPLDRDTTITRDIWGKVHSMTRAGIQRDYGYDSFERVCSISNPENGITRFSYDGANNIVNAQVGTAGGLACTAQSAPIIYSYDNRNRLTGVNYPDGTPDITNTYHADGALESTDSSASSINYFYNKRRLLTGETHEIEPNLGTYALNYAYDSLGGLQSVTYPDGSSVGYAPDVFGQATAAGVFANNVDRYANGAISSFNYGNQKTRAITLNSRFLPTAITDSGVIVMGYAYDANGNPTVVNGGGQNLNLAYDTLNRLDSSGTSAFDYTLSDDIKSSLIGGVQTTMAYTGQRLTSSTRGGQTFNYEYDARGNVTGKGDIDFVYNRGEQVTAIINKNGFPNNPSFWSVSDYAYNPLGKRIVSRSGCGSTHFVYGANGKLMWEAFDVPVPFAAASNGIAAKSCIASPKTRKHVYLDGQNLAEVETQADNSVVTRYHHNDALGSARAITTSAGAIERNVTYTAFGEPAAGTQVRGTGYTGHQMDDNGLIYMGARYYDQTVGRFLSVDPDPVNGLGTNFNRYAYANNSPYMFVDPSGRFADIFLDIGFASYSAYTLITDPSWTNAAALGADIVGAVVPIATGLGAAVRGANAGVDTARGIDAAHVAEAAGGEGSTTLYRAVGPDELNEIADTGQLINRGSAEGKYFTSSSEDASSYAKQAVNAFGDAPYTTIKVDVPNSILPSPVPVDRGIPAFVIPDADLPGLKPEILETMAIPERR